MRAGTLDRRIALQRKTSSFSSSGSPIDIWSSLTSRWSALRPLSGDERNASEQWIAREQAEFTLRWSEDISNLSPLDRIIFPVDDASNSPIPYRSIYDIISVLDVGRNVSIKIVAARRVA